MTPTESYRDRFGRLSRQWKFWNSRISFPDDCDALSDEYPEISSTIDATIGLLSGIIDSRRKPDNIELNRLTEFLSNLDKAEQVIRGKIVNHGEIRVVRKWRRYIFGLRLFITQATTGSAHW